MNTALRIVVLIALAGLLTGFTGVPEDVRLAPDLQPLRHGPDHIRPQPDGGALRGRHPGGRGLHCLAVDLAAKEHGDSASFAVADRVSKRLIDAHTAHW